MIEARQARLKELMKKNDVQCLVLFPGVDLFYTTGLQIHPSERLTSAILPVNDEPIFICPNFEKTRMEKGLTTGSVRTWEEDEDPFKLLTKVLEEFDCANNKISLDNKLWFEWFLKIQKELPKADFVDATNIVQKARIIKSEEEIILLKEASKIAATSIFSAYQEVEPGMTEIEISRIVIKKLTETADRAAFSIAQTGPNSAIPHGGPTKRKLQENDVLLIDAGPFYKGYVGDITMTFKIGKGIKDFEKVYDIVLKANRAAFDYAKEGRVAEEVDKTARKVITTANYGKYFTHRLGHGLGIEGHEPPYLVHGNKLILQAGMCHSIEPGIYLPGKFGVRIEDGAVIRKDSCEILYKTPRRTWE